MNERSIELLKASLKYLNKLKDKDEIGILSEEIYYDGTLCDGSCLLNDIEDHLFDIDIE